MAGKITQKKKTTTRAGSAPVCKTKPNRHKLAAILSALLAASQLFTGGLFMDPSHSLASQVPDSKEIIQETNDYRTTNSLNALTESPKLDQAARGKLIDMQKNNYWDHTSPQGKQPWDFINQSGYSYSYAGENLGKDFGTAKDVVDAWINSPTHRENIINKNYTDIGIAVGTAIVDNRESTLIVQIFGKPKLSPLEVGSFASVAMAAENQPSFSIVSPVSDTRLPYFILWGILFFLIVFDGIELRRCGLHTSKKHMFEFRSALLVNCFAFLLLFINIVSLA